jgi:hypothetical protein
MVPSAVTCEIPLRFGAIWVPVPIPVMASPFIVICKYLIVRVAPELGYVHPQLKDRKYQAMHNNLVTIPI